MGESQSNGIIERAVGLVAGQARTLKAALEHRIGVKVPLDARILCLAGAVLCVSDEQVRHRQRRKDTAAQTTRTKGQHTDSGIRGEDLVHACQTHRATVGDQNTYVRIISESERWDVDRILGMSSSSVVSSWQ